MVTVGYGSVRLLELFSTKINSQFKRGFSPTKGEVTSNPVSPSLMEVVAYLGEVGNRPLSPGSHVFLGQSFRSRAPSYFRDWVRCWEDHMMTMVELKVVLIAVQKLYAANTKL